MADDAYPPLDQVRRGEYAYPGPLRDALVTAIVSGEKTRTTCLLAELGPDADPADDLGTLEAVVDSHGTVVCVVRTTDVQVMRLGDVTLEHAVAEGEGHGDVAQWRADHERFWHSPEYVADRGWLTIDDDTLVVCSTFQLDRRYPVTVPVPWSAR